MDMALDGKAHDKRCWFCAKCGDDLGAALKLVDKMLEESNDRYNG
jgi:hypothetical protein